MWFRNELSSLAEVSLYLILVISVGICRETLNLVKIVQKYPGTWQEYVFHVVGRHMKRSNRETHCEGFQCWSHCWQPHVYVNIENKKALLSSHGNSVRVNTPRCYIILVHTRVGTLIVATIYLQLIQNRYMLRSFTVLQFSHQHCVQPVASDVEVVGYL